jgi:hypothetical protein
MPRPRRIAPAAVLASALALSACSVSIGSGESGEPTSAGGASEVLGAADEGIVGVQSIRVADNDHTTASVDYSLRPPAGGAHNPEWWNCGFYDQPVVDENAVHDLEHGAVWLAYAPDLAPADVAVIHDLASANPKVLAAPYLDLGPGEAVVATAWARQLRLDSVDDERLAAFVTQYQDGRQAPEPGVQCDGTSLGEPLP